MSSVVDEFEFFLEKEWSDGLPVVTPTQARVERMLEGTRLGPSDIVGVIPPVMGEATVRTVAIHAVMAGCKPEYLPVVLGGMRLMLSPELNLNAVQGTMGSAAPLMIVNGPYAAKIGLHGGNGCFGPGFRANATIGRAIRLMAQHGFQRLPVVNADPASDGQVVGVLTRAGIIRWLSDADRSTRHATQD